VIVAAVIHYMMQLKLIMEKSITSSHKSKSVIYNSVVFEMLNRIIWYMDCNCRMMLTVSAKRAKLQQSAVICCSIQIALCIDFVAIFVALYDLHNCFSRIRHYNNTRKFYSFLPLTKMNTIKMSHCHFFKLTNLVICI